jgi:hypothetical protein
MSYLPLHHSFEPTLPARLLGVSDVETENLGKKIASLNPATGKIRLVHIPTDVNGVTTRALHDALSLKVGTNEATLNTLSNTVSTNEGLLNTVRSTAVATEGGLANLSQALTELTSTVGTNEGLLNTVRSTAVTTEGGLASLTDTVNTKTQELDALKNTVTGKASTLDLDELKGIVQAKASETSLNALKVEVDAKATPGDLSSLEGRITNSLSGKADLVNGKVKMDQIPTGTDGVVAYSDYNFLNNKVNGIANGLSYRGTWDAATGIASGYSALINSNAVAGMVGSGSFWVVTTAGNYSLPGIDGDSITDWKVRDMAVLDKSGTDAKWVKLVGKDEGILSINNNTSASITTGDLGIDEPYIKSKLQSTTLEGLVGVSSFASGVLESIKNIGETNMPERLVTDHVWPAYPGGVIEVLSSALDDCVATHGRKDGSSGEYGPYYALSAATTASAPVRIRVSMAYHLPSEFKKTGKDGNVAFLGVSLQYKCYMNAQLVSPTVHLTMADCRGVGVLPDSPGPYFSSDGYFAKYPTTLDESQASAQDQDLAALSNCSFKSVNEMMLRNGSYHGGGTLMVSISCFIPAGCSVELSRITFQYKVSSRVGAA